MPNQTTFKKVIHTVADDHTIAPGRVTPPERFDPTHSWSFSDLGSACPTAGLDAGARLDPYWDGLWNVGSGASWLSIDLARKQQDAGLGTLPPRLDLSEREALDIVSSSRGWNDRLALLGALFAWRTMTVEQAAAFVGTRRLASALDPSAAALFALDVLDLGVYSNGLRNTDLTGRGALYRTSRGNAVDRIIDRFSWPEWMSVTGGQKWQSSTNYDRHNVLATELGLRLAEFTDVATVLGERFSSLDLLVGSGIGKPSLAHEQKAGDLCAVREDGMRIVVEVTANAGGSHFHEKARRWAKAMAENPLETSGLTVLFVVIPHSGRNDESANARVRARTYQAIAAACKEFPGSVRDRVAERMGVATWREWFPERGKVHDSFFTLRADRPTGRGASLWEPCDFLDPFDGQLANGAHGRPFSPRDPKSMTAVIDNSALLGNTPHWIRRRRQPDPLWPLVLGPAGVEGIPVPSPVRPNRVKGRALGQAVGRAGQTQPPPRLLGLR